MGNYNFRSYNKPSEKSKSKVSYFLVGLIGAVIGGLIMTVVAPNFLYGKIIPVPEVFINKEVEIVEDKPIKEELIIKEEKVSDITEVVKENIEAVVGITTLVKQRQWIWETVSEGVGSGVVVDSNGYILTNSHVIGDGNAETINVLFENGEELKGELLWYDDGIDLAIVKVEKTGLKAVELGDSDALQIGEIAIAIGNPLGLDFQRTVTSGIISGLNRSIQVDRYNVIEELIQTDASINPGNSGGPLLNSKGEVIGINTAKIKSGEGLGFSIPINTVKPIVKQIKKTGSYESISFGANLIDVKQYERYTQSKLKVDEGLVVVEVIPGTPAYNAGIKPGDIILEIDKDKLVSVPNFRKTLYKYNKDDKANLKVMRGKELINLEILFNVEEEKGK